jgi:LPS-assembly protein
MPTAGSAAVLDRLNTTLVTANTRILFQIEFVGFSRIGASPCRRCGKASALPVPARAGHGPSRFSNYD